MNTKQPLLSGRFITLEGGEGVGKSSQLDNIAKWLQEKGINAVITREPGGTPMAEAIRQVLLTQWQETIAWETECLLVFASRLQHINEIIKPALDDGKWVISDRFIDATYAYQGYGRAVPQARIAQLAQWTEQIITPDLTLLLDAPIDISLQRANTRAQSDRFEKESDVFFQRVRDGYLTLAAQNPERYCIVDATPPLHEVEGVIQAIFTKKFFNQETGETGYADNSLD